MGTTKKREFSAFIVGRLLILCVLFLSVPKTSNFAQEKGQESASKKKESATATKETPKEAKSPAESNSPNSKAGDTPIPPNPIKKKDPPKTVEQLKIEMLEKIADQLSRRMRALKDREKSLELRERTISERERAIGDLEELLQMREQVIKRREKLPPPQAWNGPEPPTVFGQYAVVLDGKSMQFFHTKSPEKKIPVASTQKLVTALLVCHEGNLDQVLEVPKEVWQVEPTVVGIKPGEVYTRRQLVTALLVKSGNDLAAALAIDNAGSIEAFADKMNRFAKYIGMENSNFINPHGLPAKGQYSTARDIAIAAFEAYQIPDIRDIVRRKTFLFRFNDGREVTLYNTNRVLHSLEICNGMKTGFTYAAGNCLVSSAKANGRDRIAVVLKSARPHVWEDSKKLLQWSLELDMKGPLEEADLATLAQ